MQNMLRVEVVDVRAATAEANARLTLRWKSYKQISASNYNPFED
jgi:hypothetical protein